MTTRIFASSAFYFSDPQNIQTSENSNVPNFHIALSLGNSA